MKIKKNPPLFKPEPIDPEPEDFGHTVGTEITLRDLFAGCCLVGQLAAHAGLGKTVTKEELAEDAYNMSNAMLEERLKWQEKQWVDPFPKGEEGEDTVKL